MLNIKRQVRIIINNNVLICSQPTSIDCHIGVPQVRGIGITEQMWLRELVWGQPQAVRTNTVLQGHWSTISIYTMARGGLLGSKSFDRLPWHIAIRESGFVSEAKYKQTWYKEWTFNPGICPYQWKPQTRQWLCTHRSGRKADHIWCPDQVEYARARSPGKYYVLCTDIKVEV